MARVQRIDIDGVPVFTAPGPDRATAALVFGVGIRDETYATLGITHLVEHLVMGTLPKSHLECNATVDVESTVFHATGRPAAVAAFLGGICAALADLPTDRVDLETGVLQAENCAGSHPTAAALWGARFRLAGPGLALAGGGVPEGVTAPAVLEHVRRWFVAGNAAVIWHGPLPEGLRLPLPDGPRPERARPAVRTQPGPVWMHGPAAGVGLLLRVDQLDAAAGVVLDVLQERIRDVARRERGLSYHADLHVVDVAPGHREVAVVVDAREGQEAAVARVLWEQYLDLCERGPAPDELEHAVTGFAEHVDDEDDAVLADLGRAAFSAVFGLPFRAAADGLAAWRRVTPRAAADALRDTVPSAILMLPEPVDPGTLPGGITHAFLCNVVPELPGGAVHRPSLLARLRTRTARLALVVSDDGLAHRDADGDCHAIPWEEIEAVVPADEGNGFVVVGRNLCCAFVHEDLFGRRAVESVRNRLPMSAWLPLQSRTPDPAPVPAPVG